MQLSKKKKRNLETLKEQLERNFKILKNLDNKKRHNSNLLCLENKFIKK